MNREITERIRTAGEYQKKAIRALFPEKMNDHLDVIEREMKAMVIEIMADWMKECKKDNKPEDISGQEKSGKTKKIDIL